MSNLPFKKITLIGLFSIVLQSFSMANSYIIYSITQDFPMGYKDEKINKNYFVNMGEAQGLKEGTKLDVYRTISQIDPYNNNKRHNFKVLIGELKVIHVENESAITSLSSMKNSDENPVFDIKGLLIGDSVDVQIK